MKRPRKSNCQRRAPEPRPTSDFVLKFRGANKGVRVPRRTFSPEKVVRRVVATGMKTVPGPEHSCAVQIQVLGWSGPTKGLGTYPEAVIERGPKKGAGDGLEIAPRGCHAVASLGSRLENM